MSSLRKGAIGDEANGREQPERVVTDPEVANLIRLAAVSVVIFSIATIGIYIYNVCTLFTLDGPLWEPFAWSAAELLLCIAPICVAAKMANECIRTFAMSPSVNTCSSDVTSKLLASDNV
ncbi:hypothetical protein EJB05_56451, partial [Eragrostis curvula]